MEIICNFHSGYLDCKGSFGFILLCNRLNIVEKEAQWILHFSDKTRKVCSAIFFLLIHYAGFTSHNNFNKNKYPKNYHEPR